jgi:small subunit ribosomal protein S17
MPRRILEGIVESSKALKTISVRVERRFKHPLYQKIVKKSAKYAVHDPESRYKEGDKVSIIECSPVSKTKTWIVSYE